MPNAARRAALAVTTALPALLLASQARADHTGQPGSAALAGSFQDEIGCPGDWQPDCPATDMTLTDGLWRVTLDVPAGDWEFKVALNDAWDESYGDGGGNVALALSAPAAITFTYDHATHAITTDAPLVQPGAVTIAGSFQQELGCEGDWQPWCDVTGMTLGGDGVWRGLIDLPVGAWEYKAALNRDWAESHGRGGGNVGLEIGIPGPVAFYYDHGTNWVTDRVNDRIVTAAGSFQSELGCDADWQPSCLRSWLQDPDGDGTYTFATRDIPAGSYEAKAALNEGWDENYGQGGAPNGANIAFDVPGDGTLIVFSFESDTNTLTVGGELPKGDLALARAHWLVEGLVAWNVPSDADVRMHHAAEGGLTITADGVTGDSLPLTYAGRVADFPEIAAKFRHLGDLSMWRLGAGDAGRAGDLLRGQVVMAAKDAGGAPIDATGVQPAGVLDDLYANETPLGVTWSGPAPTVSVWAPTAKSVTLQLFSSAKGGAPQAVPMRRDDDTGVWTARGNASWNRMHYLYEVEVYARETGRVQTNLVTDPYSVALSTDSQRSLIVNLADADLKPKKWDKLKKRKLAAPEDAVLYELHVRDFSATDETVPEALRGTFGAFALRNTDGSKHLRRLASAGLTHVHLLPAFDCASIPEDPANQREPGNLEGYGPDSPAPQEKVDAVRDQDLFNWCYDPRHYTAPEGSYATDSDGPARILEFRQMVAGLAQSRLRTVMDVVYNHTSGSGQNEGSVLDRIVPDYYHRLNADGFIETSSCCANTATEHAMMERLMIDSLVVWARDYKVDGFRFDLMGHHSRDNILRAKERLQALTLAEDGVDGASIYLYGEGWNFGEVANDQRFTQATQINMGQGTGVGTFNDRIRDAVRGGGPFDTGLDHVRTQGFASGLYTDPNPANDASDDERRELLRLADWVRVGLAGSVRDVEFENADGVVVRADQIGYLGQGGAGYTSDPQEAVNYVAAHDNETLFDALAYKLPRDTAPADRARMQNLATDIVLLSQGVPFLHAGQDILRSKSMDRNSYNSGDWFNVLDWSLEDNGFARGLPPEADNGASWSVVGPLLRDGRVAVGPDEIDAAARHTREMLRVRRTTPQLRLRTGAAVRDQVRFHNTGPDQIPGLIAMSVGRQGQADVMVIVNATAEAQSVAMRGRFALHPVQRDSHDPAVRAAAHDGDAFAVPARTTAVFVSKDDGDDGADDRDDRRGRRWGRGR